MTIEPPPSTPVPDYPVMLTLAGRRCLVVGGGRIGARRTEGLLACGARVTVVAPEVVATLDRMASGPSAPPTADPAATGGATHTDTAPTGSTAPGGTLEIERRRYQAGEAARYDLVLTATGDPDVDHAVVADARSAGVAVNSADGDAPGTVHLPAVQRRGRVTLSVSTGGASPALARWLSERAAAALPDHVDVLTELVDGARVALRRQGRSPGSVDWDAVLARVAPLVEAGRTDEARTVLGDL